MQTYKIAVIPGDTIGPELTAQAVKVLRALEDVSDARFELEELCACGAALETEGVPLPAEAAERAAECRAVLVGNVGAKAFRSLPREQKPEAALLALRRKLGVASNLRPVVVRPGLENLSPLKPELLENGLDIMVVRDVMGGMLAGEHRMGTGTQGREAVDLEYYNEAIVRSNLRRACQLAMGRRKKVTSLDKSNVLASGVLWRTVADEVAAEFPEITLEHGYIDAAAMEVLAHPGTFDVVVTSNAFGDILSDELAQVSGAPCLLGSAELSEDGRGIYTPNQLHTPHEELAGTGGAHPAGLLHALSMLLQCSCGRTDLAERLERAVTGLLGMGLTTGELPVPGGTVCTCQQWGDRAAEWIRREH